MIKKDKIRLIYIAPSGHSGSTLLDTILNHSSKTFSVGEFMFFEEWVQNNHLCSCNKKVNSCNFWNSIVEDLKFPDFDFRGPQTIIDQFTTKTSYGEDDIKLYGKLNYEIFNKVREKSQAEIIIDSSKSISRLKILFLSGYFDIKVLHLIRNGLDFVSSMKIPKERTSVEGQVFTKTSPVWKSTIRWYASHKALDAITTRYQLPSMVIKYEDLSNSTPKVINKLNDFLNLDIPENLTTLDLRDIHNISGSRWRHKDELTIKKSDSFRNRNLNFLEKSFFNVVAGSIQRRYYNIES